MNDALPPPPDMPDVAPDAATKITEFAALFAAGQHAAASNALLTWVNDCADEHADDRTRYFATTAATLVGARLPTPTNQFWRLDAPIPGVTSTDPHNIAMCQVVVRIANGEPAVALDLLTAHKLVHGTGGLFWLGVCAVRMLANLLTTHETRRP